MFLVPSIADTSAKEDSPVKRQEDSTDNMKRACLVKRMWGWGTKQHIKVKVKHNQS
jgi:hypothetical protein